MPFTTICGAVPIGACPIPSSASRDHSYQNESGVTVDYGGDYVCVTNENGSFAVFGGAPVTVSESKRWLDEFEKTGWQFLANIHKPVCVFVWHPKRREAIVATDRYRINWIYWVVKDSKLHFASTMQNLLASTGDRFAINHKALYSYLDLLCVSADLSIQKGVQKLSGGTCLRVCDGNVEVLHYHDMSYRAKLSGSEQDLALQVRSHIQNAVSNQLSWLPDASPFGCFLSGGTDSSSLLACASLAKGPGVPAYSVSFTEDTWDELEFAQIAAKEFNARHTVIKFDMDDALRIADQLAYQYDEPMGNPSLLATYKCVETAAFDGIKHLIAGDGGDEIFGGNARYAIDSIYSRFHGATPPLLRQAMVSASSALSAMTGSPTLLRVKRILERANLKNPERYYLDDAFAYKIFPQAFSNSFAQAVDPEVNLDIFRGYYQKADADEEIDRLLYIDMRHTLGDNDLVKVGISGRANGVNILYPMLDDDLVVLASRLPGWAKLKGNEKRYLFKRAMAGLVPEKILHKKKQGFGVPVAHWLRSSDFFIARFKDVVFDKGGLAMEVINDKYLTNLLNEHQSGIKDNGMFLWGLYCLNLWHAVAKQWGR